MMANYQIITDKQALLDFIEWLPELGPTETFYCCLFARNKYCKDVKHISSDKAQLKRFTCSKDRLFNKIQQLEVPLGTYKQFRSGKEIEIPQEALALYIGVNPRCMKKAIKPSIMKLLEINDTATEGFNIHAEVLSQIQKSTSNNKRYLDLDFDIDKSEFSRLKKSLEAIFDLQCITFLESRGGYHVLVDLKKVSEFSKVKNWFLEISKIPGLDNNSGPAMIPVVGTYQGGFTPKLIKT